MTDGVQVSKGTPGRAIDEAERRLARKGVLREGGVRSPEEVVNLLTEGRRHLGPEDRVQDEVGEPVFLLCVHPGHVTEFEAIMKRLGIPRSPLKPPLAIAVERVGRLKLNGRVIEYSPLSRFAELDFLAIGIDGKKLLWANLRDLADLRAQLPDVDFDHLIARAERQRAEIEPFRSRAGREALAGSDARQGRVRPTNMRR
jgi:hypothetical protein